jgi:hypothetical protein
MKVKPDKASTKTYADTLYSHENERIVHRQSKHVSNVILTQTHQMGVE